MLTRRHFGWLTALFFGVNRPSTARAATLADDIRDMSAWIAAALQSSGYNTDFTPASIAEVERFFVEHVVDGQAVPGGLLSEDLGARLFALGSYCGEVLRREIGGEWITDDADPEGEINAALKLANGAMCWPMQRVGKRFQGAEENLVHWAELIRNG